MKIINCTPARLNNGVREYNVFFEDRNSKPMSDVVSEQNLTNEMRAVLTKQFVEKFYLLPNDLQRKIKTKLK